MNFNFENCNIEDGDGDYVFEEADRQNEVFNDDGSLHIIFNGIRHVWDIGQEVSSSEYNRTANSIVRSCGIVGSRFTGVNN